MGKLADPGGAETFQRGEEEESVFQFWTGSAWERLSEPEQALNQTPAADARASFLSAVLLSVSAADHFSFAAEKLFLDLLPQSLPIV